MVGGKDFTEQLIMAEMTAQLLRAHGFSVDTRTGMGSTVLRRALVNGQIDVYWEYTGSRSSSITRSRSTCRLSGRVQER